MSWRNRQLFQDTYRNFQRVGGIWVRWWGGEQWEGAIRHLVVRKECKASMGDVNVKSWNTHGKLWLLVHIQCLIQEVT